MAEPVALVVPGDHVVHPSLVEPGEPGPEGPVGPVKPAGLGHLNWS